MNRKSNFLIGLPVSVRRSLTCSALPAPDSLLSRGGLFYTVGFPLFHGLRLGNSWNNSRNLSRLWLRLTLVDAMAWQTRRLRCCVNTRGGRRRSRGRNSSGACGKNTNWANRRNNAGEENNNMGRSGRGRHGGNAERRLSQGDKTDSRRAPAQALKHIYSSGSRWLDCAEGDFIHFEGVAPTINSTCGPVSLLSSCSVT